ASAYRSIFRWAKFPAAVLGAASWGGPGTETVRAIRFTDDAIIVTGQFDKELSFGTTPLLTGPDLNGYLIALSPDLSVVYWSHSLGGDWRGYRFRSRPFLLRDRRDGASRLRIILPGHFGKKTARCPMALYCISDPDNGWLETRACSIRTLFPLPLPRIHLTLQIE
ncbi:MAG TPA: hypothetical protein PLV85_24670, partial [Polyangiaceae bacterium]|nr:hypothetical protein [Polyangiaceae bacterium]HQB46832.1 hypothetical protein [Polyangiaceae bacterium]